MCVSPPRRLHLPCDPLAAANHLMGLVPKLIVSQPFPIPVPRPSGQRHGPEGSPTRPGDALEGPQRPQGWC